MAWFKRSSDEIDFLRGRAERGIGPEGMRPPTEEEITNPGASFTYATEILHGRFIEGEDAIALSSFASYLYARDILHGRWPEGEVTILEFGIPEHVYLYAKEVIKGIWQEGEAVIAEDNWYSLLYARNILHGRFLLGEKAIAKNPHTSEPYRKTIYPEFKGKRYGDK